MVSISTPLTATTATTTTSTEKNESPFYQKKRFGQFYPLVGLYALTIKIPLLFVKLLPIQPSFLKYITQPTKLHPQDCFILLPSDDNNDDTNNNKPIALVTGANTGIGFETASTLIEKGYDVILACRSRDKGEKAASILNQRHHTTTTTTTTTTTNLNNPPPPTPPGKALFIHPLDLSSFTSIKSFTKILHEKYTHLNILVNNAGINTTGISMDGLDLCFQTNFVGHYLLTRLVMPLLLKAKNYKIDNDDVEAGRVVNLSSVTHHFAHENEERKSYTTHNHNNNHHHHHHYDEEWWKGCTIPNESDNTYKESKLASLIFTHELNKRYSSKGLRAISVNPGSVDSDIWRGVPKFSMMNAARLLYLNTREGSTTSIAGAIGNLPKGAVYLQPYWLPNGELGMSSSMKKMMKKKKTKSFCKWFQCPFPVCEMMGPYVGHVITEPRLPIDIDESSTALWNAFSDIVGLEKEED